MLCFFYGRNPKNFQQDTVLQHARMYGARAKEDMAVTRLHTTDLIHKILVRMNELDNQLREWFIAGKDKADVNAVFLGYDKNIKPCAMQKIKASNALTLKPQIRMLPVGFWTGGKTATSKTLQKIDELIEYAPGFAHKDDNGFFEMDKNRVVEILKLVESMYVFDDKPSINNLDHKNDVQEMLCALEYCTDKSNGKVYVLHRTDRDMGRIRANGGWIDAPDDGRTDTKPSREKAIDAPVLMLIRQNGNKKIDEATGINVGWNNTPFYWPVLMTQKNINPVMFAIDQSKKKKMAAIDNSDILEGINPEEVLKMTYKGDLEDRFGKEGTVYTDGKMQPQESRTLKETTASKFILKDGKGNWLMNPNVEFDESHDHGLYSFNGGRFPFVFRPYKYMLLANGRNARADLMLMELDDMSTWFALPDGELNENGDLYDLGTDNLLLHGSDIIYNKDMDGRDYTDRNITQWVIVYPIKKVLKFKKNSIVWDALFEDDEE